MVLFMQGIMFYFPHWLWKQLDGGRIKNIIVGLNAFITDEGARDQKIKSLADYMHMRAKLGGEHNKWAGKFFFCECLNFVNVIWQIIFTDIFLDGEFSKFGTEVIKFSNMEPEDRVDPMSRVFPRMTKCIFQKFGGSGTIQRFDSLCVLSMNILNEKIYIFLWFWFIILAIITGINIVVRIFQMCSSTARNRFIKLESRGYLGTAVDRNDVHAVVQDLNYSDWLIFYFLAQSMDQRNFGQLVKHMAQTPDRYNSKKYADQRQGNGNGDQEMQPLADAERGAGGNNGDDGGDGGDKIYPNLDGQKSPDSPDSGSFSRTGTLRSSSKLPKTNAFKMNPFKKN